ncbi:uncharacterized protein BDZ99DRAFT_470162 [Mytilinidion resinicola]|uniref:Uncharacterized protein n=1 Tax=Mytilinidion resinicola TaxID=574789 RepID=A0A6A6Z8S6_9PEZI|nr:uncharacterized protein BDZ99DRAFT_470162 [Mytilinidion resinicola]KAF2817109.1 hypothetical protein BDZ99DRAFT_470162 [Mytilinidion resinicola]
MSLNDNKVPQETIEGQLDRQLSILRGPLAPAASRLRSMDLFFTSGKLEKDGESKNENEDNSMSTPLESLDPMDAGDWAFEIRIDKETCKVTRSRGAINDMIRRVMTHAQGQLQQAIDTKGTENPGLSVEDWEEAISVMWTEMQGSLATAPDS